MNLENEVLYSVNPPVTNNELNLLSAVAWGNNEPADSDNPEPTDFRPILEKSLAFVCAHDSARLVGFVNVAWDGGIHAFVLDTMVHPEFQRRGIGKRLIEKAVEAARKGGIEWLHVDFEPHLQDFYDKCGFKNTRAGLINLKD